MAQPFPLIEVAGPPRERGRDYGRQAAARIRLGVDHYTAQLGRASLDWPAVRALVREYLPQIEQFEPAYVEEMCGIAEGAGLDFEAVVLLNARTEVLKVGSRPDLDSSRKRPTAAPASSPCRKRRSTAGSSRRRTGTGRRNAPTP